MFTLILLTSLKVVVVLLGSLVRLGGTSRWGSALPYLQYIMFILYHYISHTRTYYIYIYILYIYICCIYVTYIYIYIAMNTYTEAYIEIHAYFICRYAYLQTDGHIEGNLNSKYFERRGRWQGRSGC